MPGFSSYGLTLFVHVGSAFVRFATSPLPLTLGQIRRARTLGELNTSVRELGTARVDMTGTQ